MDTKIPIKCVECGRIIWAPVEDADLEMACPVCLQDEMEEMKRFNPIRYMDWFEDTRLPED